MKLAHPLMASLAILTAIQIAVVVPLPAQAKTASPSPATAVTAQQFANGNDWQRATPQMRQAFLFGMANLLSVAVDWDDRHVPADQQTFSRRARVGLADVSLGEVAARIDRWYGANPDRLDTPVIVVMWDQVAKPRLQQGR
ncbi:hypothetical protein [Aeromonas sanarellii]|uniref:hypothetical protein n=1 Tax=Aeromonas sanarellii TaxID=633415 RepID=UPI003988F3B7